MNSLYFDSWGTITSTPYFLYMFIGGRGIGKTYSTLKGVLLDNEKFMYVRRTEKELKNCCNPINSPFLTLNRDLGRDVKIKPIEDSFVIIENEEKIGVCGCLSTFGKFRGSDFSDIDYIIFDEFINTSPINTLKHEDDLFFNLLETVGRNREIQGKEHLKVILLANSNTLDSGILRALRLGELIRVMKATNKDTYVDAERGIYLSLPKEIGITKKKKETALYKLTQGTNFYDMAIQNDFVTDLFDTVKKIDYKRLVPMCSYDNLYIYQIKNSSMYYVCTRKHTVDNFKKEEKDKFISMYKFWFKIVMENNMLYFSNYDLKLDIDDLMK